MARVDIASDDFNGRASLGSNWAQVASSTQGDITLTPAVTSTFMTANSGGECVARWVGAGSFTNDQGARLGLTAFLFFSGGAIGVACRISADTDGAKDYYLAELIDDSATSTKTIQLSKRVNGTQTIIASGSASWAINDLIEIEAEGTTIRMLKNGSVLLSVTDTSLATGAPGVRSSSGYQGDNWVGFNVTAGGAAASSALLLLGVG